MECELCGTREASKRAKIEGVVLSVCDRCAKYGEEVKEMQKPVLQIKKSDKERLEIFEEVPVENLGEIVKRLREKRKLSQEELAREIKEKVSVIKRIEDGWVPEERIIKKLERFFETKLTEEIRIETKIVKSKPEKLTIGDVAEIK